MGYPQRLYYDPMLKGKSQLYCIRALITRSGIVAWDAEQGTASLIPRNAAFELYYTCPLRTLDGRDAYFKIDTGFYVYGEELASNPNILDERLAEIDAWLEPTWQSLVLMPQAYQFDPPEGAQQSVFCASHGLCWKDMKKNP